MSLEDLRREVAEAQQKLRAEVERTCPATHDPVQHRDGKPRWCNVCGRGFDGRMWRGEKA